MEAACAENRKLCLRDRPIEHRNVDFFAPASVMWTFLSQIDDRHENLVAGGANNGHESASIGQDPGPRSAARTPLSVASPDRCDTERERARPETLGDRRRLVKRSAGGLRLAARLEVPAVIGERPRPGATGYQLAGKPPRLRRTQFPLSPNPSRPGLRQDVPS